MAPTQEAPKQSKPKRRILVIEPDVAVRRLVALLLIDAGFDALPAAEIERGLASIEAGKIDVVVCCSEAGDGSYRLSLAEQLRERTNAAIVLTSGAWTRSGREQAHEPSYAFLEKPFARDELLSVIDFALSREQGEQRPRTGG